MQELDIGFIGAGNMARALAAGLIADGIAPQRLIASDVDSERLAALARELGVRSAPDNASVARSAEVVVLAVKPQVLRLVAAELAAAGLVRPLYISIAAGIRTADLGRWLGSTCAIVRAMPNTPAMVGSAATALYANPRVTAVGRERAEAVLRAVGIVQWLEDEALMDLVTALSGSGPAYYFLMMELTERLAVERGLPADIARLFSIQTAFGAAKMALESAVDPARLRAQVASPGGTTERALAALRDRDLEGALAAAIDAARERAAELARTFGGE